MPNRSAGQARKILSGHFLTVHLLWPPQFNGFYCKTHIDNYPIVLYMLERIVTHGDTLLLFVNSLSLDMSTPCGAILISGVNKQ